MTRETVSTDIKRRGKAIGIEQRVYNHLIRHSFTKFMLKSGASLEQVSKLLGHKTVETTYKHYFDVMLDELAETMHQHHPHFKQQQTLEVIHEKAKAFLQRFINPDRFHLQTVEENDTIHFKVQEKKL